MTIPTYVIVIVVVSWLMLAWAALCNNRRNRRDRARLTALVREVIASNKERPGMTVEFIERTTP